MESPLKYNALNKIHTMAIYGAIGSGKTSLAYKIIDLFKDKMDIYFVKHPKPGIINKLGFNNMYSLEQMERLEDVLIYLDEPQLWLSVYDHKANSIIAKICSLARQKNIKLIISSVDTRVFTLHNESFFDAWMIKDLDYDFVKNGSLIKRAVKNVAVLDPSGFKLDVNEFIFWSRKLVDFNGKHEFRKPIYFSEEHSKPYKMAKKIAKKIKNKKEKSL